MGAGGESAIRIRGAGDERHAGMGIPAGAAPAVRTPGSGGERPAFENAVEHLGGGGEGAGAPGHDLYRAADALQERGVGVGRPLDLDPVGAALVHGAAMV